MKDKILKCKSKSDVCRLYRMSINGNYMKKIDKILKEYDIPLDIFDERKIYDKNPKYCKNCGGKISYEQKRNLFCSSNCSATYNNKKRGNREDNTKEKISDSLKDYYSKNKNKNYVEEYVEKVCENCGKIEKIRNTKRLKRIKYCSEECRKIGTSKNLSIMMKKRIEGGLHKGWQSRNILSYPEKFFIKVLTDHNLFDLCKVNFPYGGYFLDFYFENKKIDLEIDGKQHEQEDRIIHDIKRTNFLISENIKVYRIKWKNINTEKGKQYIKNEIDNFLKFYYNN